MINDEIERLRLSTVSALLSGRNDVVVVSSVSCLFGMGNPADFDASVIEIRVGQQISRNNFLRQLVGSLYSRNEADLARGTFRVRGDTVEIRLAYEDITLRVSFWGDEIESIKTVHPVDGVSLGAHDVFKIYPANLFVTSQERQNAALSQIALDLGERIGDFEREDRLLEAQRIRERVTYDMEMIRELGHCSGIENYSRYFDGRRPGERPFCLLDYFPKNFLTIIDESHVTVPQIRAMYGGDVSRKNNLVDYGFRLPAALDNRPLKFDEFEALVPQTIYVSATPADYELARAEGVIVEQVIRPTGLLDPIIEVRPSLNQIDDLMEEIRLRTEKGERTLVTTLTKRMAEELNAYLQKFDIQTAYMHSDVDTMERIKILDDLRAGVYDVLIGVNLLREGLDLPEVSLVAILDADKEGFLRSHRSLTQTVGRAARNLNGRVIMYADKVTDSMRQTIEETERRRSMQLAYNEQHGITPQAIVKARNRIVGLDRDAIEDLTPAGRLDKSKGRGSAAAKAAPKAKPKAAPLPYENEFSHSVNLAADPVVAYMTPVEMQKNIDKLRQQMMAAAKKMDFLEAARLRDEMLKMQNALEAKEAAK